MSLTNLPFLKPTIKMKAVSPTMAIYGHILSLIGGFFLLVSGIFNFLGTLIALSGVLTGFIILIIEFDQISFPPLKDPLTRGIVWMLLAAFSIGVDFLAILVTFVGAVCYIVYHNR